MIFIDFSIYNCKTNAFSWEKIKALEKDVKNKLKLCRLAHYPTTPHFHSLVVTPVITFLGNLSELSSVYLMFMLP